MTEAFTNSQSVATLLAFDSIVICQEFRNRLKSFLFYEVQNKPQPPRLASLFIFQFTNTAASVDFVTYYFATSHEATTVNNAARLTNSVSAGGATF